jgi:hypothetical protein
MLAHPRCPCTRASLDELAEVLSHSQGLLRAYILFFTPKSPTATWFDGSIWQKAMSLKGARVIADPGGAEAGLFGAQTSGEILLYDRSGKRLFRGGITRGRGTAGESLGSRAILSLITDGSADRTLTSVYGCPIFGHGEKPLRERTACNH